MKKQKKKVKSVVTGSEDTLGDNEVEEVGQEHSTSTSAEASGPQEQSLDEASCDEGSGNDDGDNQQSLKVHSEHRESLRWDS